MMQGSLAERLRVLRAQRGLTLVEAAEKTGIGRDTLSDLERSRRHPVMPTLAKIAEGYGVPVEELLEEPVPLGEAPSEEGTIGVGEKLEIALADKLRQQLGTNLRVLREKKSIARSDEDLHEAAKGFHTWWLYAFDQMNAVVWAVPEARGPRLAEAVEEASKAVRAEVPKGAPDPRSTPDMAEVQRGWSLAAEPVRTSEAGGTKLPNGDAS